MALLLLPVNGLLRAKTITADFSSLERTDLSEVSQIIDPLTLQLHDGQLVRLSGIEVPDFDSNAPGEYALLAIEILRDLLSGQIVQLYQVRRDEGQENRMGMKLAHVQRQSNDLWAQGMLLSLGLARVRTSAFNPDMATAMYDLERKARAEKIGIWAEDSYRILSPDEVQGFEKTVQIVEGRVTGTAINKNRIYINFGPDWRTDFTVSIAPEDKRVFSKAGIDPLQWNGKLLRVRGYIDTYNGPYIQVNHPEAIEILE